MVYPSSSQSLLTGLYKISCLHFGRSYKYMYSKSCASCTIFKCLASFLHHNSKGTPNTIRSDIFQGVPRGNYNHLHPLCSPLITVPVHGVWDIPCGSPCASVITAVTGVELQVPAIPQEFSLYVTSALPLGCHIYIFLASQTGSGLGWEGQYRPTFSQLPQTKNLNA